MKLIVLYGPPAVGKYTVAKIIADKIGYKFFHNHLSIDVAKAILPFGAPGFFELSDKIRQDVFEEATKQNIPGIVFTSVYRKEKGERFVRLILSLAEKCDIQPQFIQLYCEKEVLMERVKSEHRKEMDKLTSPEELSKLLEDGEFQSSIPDVGSERIDSTNLSVDETAAEALALIKQAS